jgi:hypothetical protein
MLPTPPPIRLVQCHVVTLSAVHLYLKEEFEDTKEAVSRR